MRSVDTIVPELVGRRLLREADVVARGVEARFVRGRNRTFRVTFADGGGGVFVKEPEPIEGTRDGVAREAELYAHLASRGGALAGKLPRLLAFDADSGTLFLEWIPNAVTLREVLSAPREARGEDLGAEIGRALAAVHAASGDCAALLDAVPAREPSVFRLHRPGPRALSVLSRAAIDLVKILQHEADACDALDTLQRAWRSDVLMHGDIRGENLLVEAGATPRVYVIDWELFRRGDAAWDVAGVLHEILVSWLLSMPLRDETPEANASRAKIPLQSLGPFARGFWGAYAASFARAEDASALLERAVVLTGARMIHWAHEACGEATRPSGHALAALQIGVNILEDPTDACFGLFGIPAPWVRLAIHPNAATPG